MRLQHVLGPGIHFVDARVLQLAAMPLFYFYVIVFGVGASLLNPSQILSDQSLPLLIVFWGVMIPVFLLIYMTCLYLALRGFDRMGFTWMPEAIVLALAIALIMPIQIGFRVLLSIEPGGWSDFFFLYAFLFVYLEIAILIYMLYGDRVLFPEMYSAKDEPLEPPDVCLKHVLRGTDIPPGELEAIVACEGQVEFIGSNGSQEMERPFGAVLSELPSGLGFQIHRSTWVSCKIAANVYSEGRRKFVETGLGQRLPVSRSREREFLRWRKQLPRAEIDENCDI